MKFLKKCKIILEQSEIISNTLIPKKKQKKKRIEARTIILFKPNKTSSKIKIPDVSLETEFKGIKGEKTGTSRGIRDSKSKTNFKIQNDASK